MHNQTRSSDENVVNASTASATPTLGPPKPPRSAFMCFADAEKPKLIAKNPNCNKKDLLKLVADAWRALSGADRAFWDEEARNDKVRFVREKNDYKGPWNLPKRRAKKHPCAPKRPPSAFLKYSQKRRAMVKEANPDMSNTDVSRLLGEMWRNAMPAERAPYKEQEERERAKYKQDIQHFRSQQAKEDAQSRTSHQTMQQNKKEDKPAKQQRERAKSHRPVEMDFEPVRIHSVDDKKPASFHPSGDPLVFRPVARSPEETVERPVPSYPYQGQVRFTDPRGDPRLLGPFRVSHSRRAGATPWNVPRHPPSIYRHSLYGRDGARRRETNNTEDSMDASPDEETETSGAPPVVPVYPIHYYQRHGYYPHAQL